MELDLGRLHSADARPPTVLAVWASYLAGWRRRPWLALLAILAVLCLAAGVVGTIRRDPAGVLFIPGLILLYLHHLLIGRTRA